MAEINFDNLMARYEELQAAQKAIGEEIDQIRAQLEEQVKATDDKRMFAGGYRINLVASHSKWIDTAAMKKDYPTIVESYVRTKEFTALKIQKLAK